MRFQFTTGSGLSGKTDLVVVPCSANSENAAFGALDSALSGCLAARARKEDFKGQKDRTLIWEGRLSEKPLRIIAVGTGLPNRPDDFRWGIGRAVRFAAAHSLSSLTVVLGNEGPEGLRQSAAAAVEAVLLGNYQFTRHKSKAKSSGGVKQVVIEVLTAHAPTDQTKKLAEKGIIEGRSRAEAVIIARDLVNEPANVLSPAVLAERANDAAIAKGFECTVWTEKEIRKNGMGLLQSVAAGSDRPPRFIHLVYRPRRKAAKRVVLVGKGVTFDTGGLCIKPGKSMYEMKTDMAGAATVIGIFSALKTLGVRAEVHGIIPATDNGVNGKATRPGDVFKSMSGKTVEVLNTDAEGRLILADALTYACRLNPNVIVDFATLTGACEVALGSSCAGLFVKRDEDVAALEQAALCSGESVWRLPLLEDLESGIKSDVADLKNIGGRFGGAITAALFLKQFTADVPWAHFDIAGPARLEKATPVCPKGASGFGVLTGLTFLASF